MSGSLPLMLRDDLMLQKVEDLTRVIIGKEVCDANPMHYVQGGEISVCLQGLIMVLIY